MDIERILDFIFPPVCVGCGEIGEWICTKCYKKYFIENREECMNCRKKNTNFDTHPNCFTTTQIDQCLIGWEYNNLSKKIMKTYKYDYRYAISNWLSVKITERFQNYLDQNTLLLPVPSHSSKIKERGFNQSKILASKIGKLKKLDVIEPLERIKDSHQHAGMKREERISDENPFRLIPEFKDKLTNINLIIIDDVCTTGTTLTQCAIELRKAHPKSVSALALFRGKR